VLPGDFDFRWANHALIVLHSKEVCRAKPRCEECPLTDICVYHGSVAGQG
jgi:endonuclease III